MLVPATTANPTPSRITSTAAAAARRASAMFAPDIDPERSMMMISAAPSPSAAPAGDPPADVTVMTALTSRPPTGRYLFWKVWTVNSGAFIQPAPR